MTDIKMSTYRYLSLGAGVQSSALLVLAGTGRVPKPDVAIFADTGDEPAWVYRHLEVLKEWAEPRGIPIHRVSYGCLSEHVIQRHRGLRSRFAAIPAFTLGTDGRAAPLGRQCTREYKITPIEKEVRRLMGYKPRQRIPKDAATSMIGISLDEVTRISQSRTPWITNTYPLVDLGLCRSDCLRISVEAGLPEPRKSSCIFCPYHSDRFWRELKRDNPEEWARAVDFDHEIRDMSMSGVKRPVYLHRSLVPLNEVDLGENQIALWDEECAGVCGV